MNDDAIAELRELHRRLGVLLSYPEPGLISWLSWLSETLTELALWSGTDIGLKAYNSIPKQLGVNHLE